MPARINRLAIQFAQDGHLSFKQKWRALIMQAFGHEGLIATDDLLKNSHCTVLNTDIYRLKRIKLAHLAWRKLLNPFKWLEFFVSLLEFLPWCLHHSISKLALRSPFHNKFLGFLTFIYLFLANFLFAPISHIAVHFALAIIRPLLAPVRHIIRPSLSLRKKSPLLFDLMLLATLALTAGLAWWFLVTSNLSLVIAGIALTSSFGGQLALIALAALSIWTVLLKCHSLIADLVDISKKHISIKQQNIEVYLDINGYTDNICIAAYRLNPKNTQINKPEEQTLRQTLALFTGTERMFYPSQPGKKLPRQEKNFLEENKLWEIARHQAELFLTVSNLESLNVKMGNILDAYIKNDSYLLVAHKLGLINPKIKKGQVISILMDRIKNIQNQGILETVFRLMQTDPLNAIEIVMRNQPITPMSLSSHS